MGKGVALIHKFKKRDIIKKRSLYYQFFLSLLLVSLCSVMILTIFYFYWFQAKAISSREKINKSTLLNTESVFESYVEFAQNYAMELYNNPDIEATILSGNIDWSERLQTSVEQINRNLRINKYINAVYIFNHDGLVFNVENKPVTDEAKASMFQYIQRTGVKNSPVFWELKARSNGEDLNTMTVFFRDYIKGDIFDGVAVNVHLNELQHRIFSRQTVGWQSLFILDSKGNVIMQGGSSQVVQARAVHAALEGKLSPDITYDSFTSIIDGEDYIFSYAAIRNGKYYIVLKEASNLSMSEFIKTRNIMLSLCAALVLVITAVSMQLSYRLYRPIGHMFLSIRKLADHLVDKNVNRNELESIDDTIANVELRISALGQEIDSNTVIKFLISPTEGSEKLPGDLLERSGIIRAAGVPYCVILLRIHQYKAWIDGVDADTVIYRMNSICTVLSDGLEGTVYCSSLQTTEGHIALIVSELCGGVPLYDIDLVAIIADKQNNINEAFRLNFVGGISSISDNESELKIKYNEALDLLKFRIVYDINTIIQADILRYTIQSNIPDDVIDAVVDAVKKGDLVQYQASLNQMFQISHEYTISVIVKAFSRLIAAIEQIMNDVIVGKTPTQHINLLDIYNRVCNLDCYDDLRSWIDELFSSTSEVILNATTKKTLNIITDAIDYVNSHYHDPQLSVQNMAVKLTISIPYFSKLFNDYTGSSFPDYVNNIRLERAMELLIKERSLEIGEVAGRVGYNSSTYFTTLFKKKFGVTPSKYRLMNMLEK
ncbi:AraC family transcriptional regulator [Paenibacillus donghaensis]|uniref:HTH araC/xylS-type domain-containing protein n=1 Tax=Paenibacillus donghaensis TaxID=414771 RepID=A0A2Z2KJJ3_9BACL|nr:helix-turn-helix domain-containing protein [Paenibacillus donghaensis]ASA23460.1 hypothetical protein B9T62_23225 [Paenibacillus donghaensis]